MSIIDSVSGYETIPPLANNFPVKIRCYTAAGGPVPHWHEHLELLHFTSGKSSVIVGGRVINAVAGDIIVVNSKEIHSFVQDGSPTEYRCILIYPEFFSDVDFSGILINNHIKEDEIAIRCIDMMLEEQDSDEAGSDMMQKAIAYRLMSHLMRNQVAERLSEKNREMHSARLSRLNAVLEYVASHYTSQLTTKDLAEASYLSDGHFCRFFKSATGKTPLEYINDYRAERACVLLSDTDMTLSEISHAVGFDDPNYFSRSFKKARGISPSRYRSESKHR